MFGQPNITDEQMENFIRNLGQGINLEKESKERIKRNLKLMIKLSTIDQVLSMIHRPELLIQPKYGSAEFAVIGGLSYQFGVRDNLVYFVVN